MNKYLKREVLFLIKFLKELKAVKFKNKNPFLIKNEIKSKNVTYLKTNRILNNNLKILKLNYESIKEF